MEKIRKVLHKWWLRFRMFYCPKFIKKLVINGYFIYWAYKKPHPLIYPTHKLIPWMDWPS